MGKENFQIVTTSSEAYFNRNCVQLVKSADKFYRSQILVYSEDEISINLSNMTVKDFQRRDEILSFIHAFRQRYNSKLDYMHYAQRMDIWIFKIAAIAQFLNDDIDNDLLFLDADSVFISPHAPNIIKKFLEPARDYDLGIFRRTKTFLHPETGFLFVKNLAKNKKVFGELLNDVLSWKFLELPSWTDDSLIDDAIIKGKFRALDFCEFYNLKSENPIYESELQKVYLHLKGKRKGKYSRVKHIAGKYR